MEGLNIFGLIQEASKELQFNDLENFWEELRKTGMNDQKKLNGMFKKAKMIAKQQNKENDKKTITGIIKSFLEE